VAVSRVAELAGQAGLALARRRGWEL
jgi:hypothetical protein